MNASIRTQSCKHAAALAVMAVIALIAVPAAAAAADDLAAAKAAGHVGERTDGTLGVVDANAPASVMELVERVNQQRQAIYAEIAAKNGTSVAEVAAQAGQTAIERTAPGHYVQDASGAWVTK
jgi:uncharacterized protein YdbL (DUF1318 family)